MPFSLRRFSTSPRHALVYIIAPLSIALFYRVKSTPIAETVKRVEAEMAPLLMAKLSEIDAKAALVLKLCRLCSLF